MINIPCLLHPSVANPRYITSSVKRPGTSILLAVVANDLSVE